jgi:glycosyltransferase involved in cell wall biosynthesis
MAVNNITVSVVIPCYNSAETIESCLKSVLSQTYQDLEILVIDDGSTDHSADIVSGFMVKLERPERLRLIKQVNAGPSSARNTGVRMALGKWVAFLDSDDCWDVRKLAIQMEYASLNSDLALLGVECAKPSGAGSSSFSSVSFDQLLFKNYFKTSGVLMRRSVALEIPFDEKMKYSEDYRVWLLTSFKYKVGIINKNLCDSIVRKKAFGESGLSSNLVAMQKGEIANYRHLYNGKHINLTKYLECIGYSYLKYFRRIMITFAKY